MTSGQISGQKCCPGWQNSIKNFVDSALCNLGRVLARNLVLGGGDYDMCVVA